MAATSSPWRKVLQERIHNFVMHHKRVDMVISPDWDGIVSTVLMNHYVRQTYPTIEVQVVGTYDCKNIVTLGNGDSVAEALFLDLDLPMDGVCHIGQHLLGQVPLSHEWSFNPNAHFQNFETWTKYPFGTAQILFYGLFEEKDFPPIAEVLLAHADSSHSNAKKYRPNAKKWIHKMFRGEAYMQRLIDGSYFKEMLNEHLQLVDDLNPYVKVSSKYTGSDTDRTWERCRANQCVRGKDAQTMVKNLQYLLNYCAECFRVACPAFKDKATTAKSIWCGRRKYYPLSQAYCADGGIEGFLASKSAKSHAIVNSKLVSVTLPPLEELDLE